MARRTLLALGATILAGMSLLQTPAPAQQFPSKPITFVVPYAPGGISDILARSLAAAMEEDLKQPVVVLNKPSPGIVLGLTEVSKAKPDGYTIGIWSNAAYVFPKVMKQPVPYDGVDSFTFLRSYGDFVIGVAVKEDSPYKTLADLLAAGKKEPGKLKYGSIGINSGQHLQMEAVAKQAGASFVHVPQTGTAANIANVLGGHLDFLSDASSWTANVKQGQLRLLAISGTKRNPYFPDVPTFGELGFKQELWGRGSVVAPAGLPEAVQKRLEEALDKAMGSQKVQDAVAGIAQVITSIPGADMKAWAVADRKTWDAILASQ
jgi:tripartite-type tricarboxylate transporter receptor subunit TctC